MFHWFQRLQIIANIITACLLDRLLIHVPDGLMADLIVSQHAVGGQEVNNHLRYANKATPMYRKYNGEHNDHLRYTRQSNTNVL